MRKVAEATYGELGCQRQFVELLWWLHCKDGHEAFILPVDMLYKFWIPEVPEHPSGFILLSVWIPAWSLSVG